MNKLHIQLDIILNENNELETHAKELIGNSSYKSYWNYLLENPSKIINLNYLDGINDQFKFITNELLALIIDNK